MSSQFGFYRKAIGATRFQARRAGECAVPSAWLPGAALKTANAGNAGSDNGAVLAVALVGRLVARNIVHGNVERPR